MTEIKRPEPGTRIQVTATITGELMRYGPTTHNVVIKSGEPGNTIFTWISEKFIDHLTELDEPQYWPPQIGDVWENTANEVWYCYFDHFHGKLALRTAYGHAAAIANPYSARYDNGQRRDWTLGYRVGGTP